MSIAGAAASAIDGDLLKTIQTSKDEHSKNYDKIQNQIRAVRDSNRRKDVYVKFVYTLVPRIEDPHRFTFQVDAEENTPDFSHIGDEVPDAVDAKVHEHLNEVYTPDHFTKNQWGVWMTGFAPIYDKKGNYVATIGVDLRASDVIANLNKLLKFGLFAFLGSLVLSILSAYILARQTTRSLQTLCEGVHEIGTGHLNKQIHLATHDEFDTLAKEINQMTKGLQERERLRLNFARYVSQHVLETITLSDKPVKLEGERRKITLLFSDIRQFTKLSEKLSPEEVVSLLNEYFGLMVEIIFKNHGTLDKFIGDGIMIEFGAPLDDQFQELHALQTAIEMQEEIKKLNHKWQQEGKPSINIGIGIHTGIAVVGNIGSEKRIQYTAIGDTVNVAARLEQLTKELKIPILISENAAKPLLDQFSFKNLGLIKLRGRIDPVIVYTLK